MGKILGAALLGIVIGGAISELIHKEKPELLTNLKTKAKQGFKAVQDAFKEGYSQTAKGEEAETASNA